MLASTPQTMQSPDGNESSAAACILVVEDDPDSLHAMMRLLQLNGRRAVAATGYREAMELWHRHHCRTLIADIQLPDGSGLDLMRELRDHGVCGVAVSGYTGREDVRASLQAGYNTHLFKPIIFAELLAALDEMCGSVANHG
jgi:two-component system CheB/CheR fusion protein